ncbi:MAG TPA: PQQ-dependent sugar dehydrogenase, partial [Solirubrobacterales bacterium]|nr:PQQ-dependent sugar dehydrogenase [Solirubrobacterales bacterium]
MLALVGSVVPPSADAAPNLGAPEVQGGLSFPWDVGFTPDGRMVVTERGGRLSVYASGEPGAPALSHTQIADVWQVGEAGLMGIAVDTSFASNSFIYVCASRTPGGASARNEVLRYVLGADHQLHGGTVILGGMAAANIHDGCAVEMDSAGFLWVTMGDANQPALAQNPNSLNGKVLRINRDGSIPAGNPFGNAVYSIGHRNPQGIAFEPGTGRVFVVEHGPQPSHGDDEINIVWAGG